MKILILFSLLILIKPFHKDATNEKNIFATEETNMNLHDSLSKYSYLLYYKTGDIVDMGACFFIKINNKTFLITTQHWASSVKKLSNNKNDDFYIRIVNNNSNNEIEVYPISTSRITDTVLLPGHITPDLFIIEVPIKSHVNSIEHLIKKWPKSNPDSGIIYGFRKINSKLEDNLLQEASVYIAPPLNGVIYKKYKITSTNVEDTLNYRLDNKLKNIQEGFSGAPVFLKFKNELFFGGMAIAGDSVNKTSIILRPQHIINKIRLLFK